jgi:hypothetical protein
MLGSALEGRSRIRTGGLIGGSIPTGEPADSTSGSS